MSFLQDQGLNLGLSNGQNLTTETLNSLQAMSLNLALNNFHHPLAPLLLQNNNDLMAFTKSRLLYNSLLNSGGNHSTMNSLGNIGNFNSIMNGNVPWTNDQPQRDPASSENADHKSSKKQKDFDKTRNQK